MSGTGIASQRARGRILVVDDNEDLVTTMGDLLRDVGYETRIAHDGPSALEIAGSFCPLVCLLDLGLPAMDGFEVARRLKAASPGGRTPTLIAITGYDQDAHRLRSREVGFDEYLVKPVDLELLLTLIEQHLNQPERSMISPE